MKLAAESPIHWFVIQCSDAELTVHNKWNSNAVSESGVRYFCGEAHARVYISRWFESICEALASRHLRRDPRSDARARQREYRANVSVGAGEPGGILPIPARKNSRRRRQHSLEPVVKLPKVAARRSTNLVCSTDYNSDIRGSREARSAELLSDAPGNLVRETRILDGASEYHATEQRRCLKDGFFPVPTFE